MPPGRGAGSLCGRGAGRPHGRRGSPRGCVAAGWPRRGSASAVAAGANVRHRGRREKGRWDAVVAGLGHAVAATGPKKEGVWSPEFAVCDVAEARRGTSADAGVRDARRCRSSWEWGSGGAPAAEPSAVVAAEPRHRRHATEPGAGTTAAVMRTRGWLSSREGAAGARVTGTAPPLGVRAAGRTQPWGLQRREYDHFEPSGGAPSLFSRCGRKRLRRIKGKGVMVIFIPCLHVKLLFPKHFFQSSSTFLIKLLMKLLC